MDQCPCGRPRAGCDYHDPALQPATKATIYDISSFELFIGGKRIEPIDEKDLCWKIAPAPRTTPPSRCIVHCRICPKRGQVGDQYHIHYMDQLTGMHFDQIDIVDGDDLSLPEQVDLNSRLLTRLRPNGLILWRP